MRRSATVREPDKATPASVRPKPLDRDAETGGPAGRLLELQRLVGNGAVGSLLGKTRPVVARAPAAPAPPAPPAPPTPATFRPVADFDTMTLSQLNDYADGQADWASDPMLAPARRQSLVNVLEFARQTPHPPLAPCGAMPVHDLESSGLTKEVRTDLEAYARGVSSIDSAGVPSTASLADARRDGGALQRLETVIPKATLHKVMGSKEEGKEKFPLLVSAGLVDSLIGYYAVASPYLETDNGADVGAYIDMMTVDKVDPISFVGRLPHVHNYHRFLAPMLETLVVNEKDVSKAKPLLLILHSSSDHNGAFHRDAEIMALVQHPRNLTIMVEGADSLEAMGAETTRIAHRQGQGGKIGQIMLAGHGGPRSMGLAGRPGDKGGSLGQGGLDLDRNRARTEKFLKGLVANMAPGPDSRIVLNSCLTAAEEVNADLSTDPKVARQQILKSLAKHPSLAGRLQQLAPGTTVEGNISSVPAGSYMAVDAAGNATGLLHQQIPSDPLATSTDLADYVEKGLEPEGCMRALVAVWAKDRAVCIDRVNKRLATAITTWGDRVVHVLYGLFASAPDNISLMNRLANDASRGLSDFGLVSEQTPEIISGLYLFLPVERTEILGPLYPFVGNTGQLAMDQVWMVGDETRRAPFLTGLDSFATTVEATPHLSFDWVRVSTAALLPLSDATKPTSAQMKLALWAVTNGSDPRAVAFLRAGATPTGHIAVQAPATVASLTGNSSSEDDILRAIGLADGPQDPAGKAPNVDLDGDGINDFYVESVTREGKVAASLLNVRARPGMASPRLDVVVKGTVLYVFGVSGSWLAIERPMGAGVGFVHQSWVRTVSPA